MSAYEREARVRLEALIVDLSGQKGLQLQDVARLAKISPATLRRAQHEHEETVTDKTLRGLERAFELVHKELDKFLTTPGYQPQAKSTPLLPDKSTSEEVVKFLKRFVAAQPEEARKVRAQVDVIWSDTTGGR
ncbi:hypothetical protein ACFQ1S_21800 [Kibdelosporangium lantanae]|uniref:HTH cro/C1-type domain-containing protein n=1 Tax=Kibdelosporangium lantanae TaxID=1497396 RepID=A0ABW3MCF2_9PSEU